MSTAAQQLSEWIERTHPDFYGYLYSHVAQRQAAAQLRNARLRGFGDDSLYFTPDLPSTGGSSDLYFTPDLPDVSSSGGSSDLFFTPDLPDTTLGPSFNLDTTSAISDQYTPVSVNIQTLTSTDLAPPALQPTRSPSDSGTMDVATDNSGGFLTSIGSGISSAASSVGNFLTSSQGLGDMTKLATAFFQLQNNKVNAQVQTAVLQAQVQRAALGGSPSPVTYAVAGNGQLVPVYAAHPGGSLPAALAAAVQSGASQYVTTPDGVSGYTIPSNIVPALSGTQSLTSVLPWVALIVGGLILAKGLSR